MNNPNNAASSGALPGLQHIPISTQPPSISTFTPSLQTSGRHVITAPTPAMPSGSSTAVVPKTPNYSKLHVALGSNSLVKSAVMTIPKLVGNKNYINWSDQVVATFCYCGVKKILTGEWGKPEVKSQDPNSKKEANKWGSLNTWIALHLNLSDSVRSQVCHLTTSFAKWEEL